MSDAVHNLTTNPTTGEPLSASGLERRERMLSDLQGEMQRVHRARRMRRRTMAAIAPVLLVATVWMVMRWPVQSPSGGSNSGNQIARNPTSDSISAPAPAPHTARPAVIVTMVRTSESILDEHRAATEPSIAQKMSDTELLDALAAINRPTGIVRTGGRVRLTHNVADPLNSDETPNSS